jgi:two-component system response regulator DesR
VNAFGAGISPIRLLLVDCQPSVRRGLKMRLALEEDLEVVGEACDAAEAIPLARDLRPDVVLMDFEMPGMSGVAATEGLRAAAPHSAVVIFTLRDDAVTRKRAWVAGAASFVAKHRTEESLLAAIREVAAEHGKQVRHDRAAAGREEEHGDDSRNHQSL